MVRVPTPVAKMHPLGAGALVLDFAPLEKAAGRAFDDDKRALIEWQAKSCLWRCQTRKPVTRRAWLRLCERWGALEAHFKMTFKRDDWIPDNWPTRGPKGYPAFAAMIRNLQSALRIGSFTFDPITDDFGGRFVEFIFQLVQQMKACATVDCFPEAVNIDLRTPLPQADAGRRTEMNAIGRFIRDHAIGS